MKGIEVKKIIWMGLLIITLFFIGLFLGRSGEALVQGPREINGNKVMVLENSAEMEWNRVIFCKSNNIKHFQKKNLLSAAAPAAIFLAKRIAVVIGYNPIEDHKNPQQTIK